MPGLDQNEAGRIKTENVEAMTVKPAMFAPPIGRHHEDERLRSHPAGEDRRQEAKGGGGGACFGHHLVQAAAGQSALGEMGIDSGQAEGQGCG